MKCSGSSNATYTLFRNNHLIKIPINCAFNLNLVILRFDWKKEISFVLHRIAIGFISSTQCHVHKQIFRKDFILRPARASQPTSICAVFCVYVNTLVHHKFKWLHIICLFRMYNTWIRIPEDREFSGDSQNRYSKCIFTRRTRTDQPRRVAPMWVCVLVCEGEVEAVCPRASTTYWTNRHPIDTPKCFLWNYPYIGTVHLLHTHK